MTPAPFRAFRISEQTRGIVSLDLSDLNPGEVVVRVAYSSVNFKDALAGTGRGKILRKFPLVGGIDLAGHVVTSTATEFEEGDAVLVTGSGLSETRDGGYGEYARVEARSVIPLPDGLDLRESMILGTAGFTAALALSRLLDNHQTPELGPLVVTGATGGVGSLAVDIFSRAGFEVHAVTGKADQHEYLRRLGAARVLDRDALHTTGALESVRYGGGLDNVGGSSLQSLLTQTAPYGSVVSAGLAAASELSMTVMPFIIRGVSLLGVASASCPRPVRERIWLRLATDWKPTHLAEICKREVGLDDLPSVFGGFLEGGSVGRTLVKI